MTAGRPKRVVKKPMRFVEEFSRSMTVKKTETPKGDKKTLCCGGNRSGQSQQKDKNSRNLTSGDFSVATREPTIITYFQMPFPEMNFSPI